MSFVSSHELFVGTSATEFSPNANMTRADLATVLWRLESSVEADGGTDFTDVPNNVYYTNAVEWASVNHVIEGTAPGIFAPVNNVTRQEMVTMIYRYVQALGMDTGDTTTYFQGPDTGRGHELMRLWILQPREVYDLIDSAGVYRFDGANFRYERGTR